MRDPSNHTYTTSNNMRAPPYTAVVEWISDIWAQFDSNIISASFDQCGLTGSPALHKVLDKLIHERIVMDNVVERVTPDEMAFTGFE
jgi:hypothetical protein